ncbi:uncharacterized protein UHOD_11988 [Ustilago sp. UG-2017b]|nr:uncharacterized protein UHOD_11988 [Ustilago sp. UG-2017b]
MQRSPSPASASSIIATTTTIVVVDRLETDLHLSLVAGAPSSQAFIWSRSRPNLSFTPSKVDFRVRIPTRRLRSRDTSDTLSASTKLTAIITQQVTRRVPHPSGIIGADCVRSLSQSFYLSIGISNILRIIHSAFARLKHVRPAIVKADRFLAISGNATTATQVAQI